MMKLMQAAVLLAAGLALGSPMAGAQSKAAAKKAPAPDYQAPSTAPAGAARGACYTDADLTAMRGRMLQQQLSVVTLQCQLPSGARAYEAQYASFLSKYSADLTTNARALQQAVARHRLNVDVVVTEFANRTAQKAPVDKDFCSRGLRALEWALDPKATSLSQVPPPYDLGPDMNIIPCAAK